jgi:hypothetical protein
MGTIVTRKRADGKPSYLCQIAKKLGGKTVREARTFHDHKAAKAWIRQREAELDNPHSFKAATQTTHTLDDAISRYIAEYGGEVGKTNRWELSRAFERRLCRRQKGVELSA